MRDNVSPLGVDMPYCFPANRLRESLFLIWIFGATLSQRLYGQVPASQNPIASERFVTISDGTAVEMRFAQMVIGRGPDARVEAGDTPDAEAGDIVRLVSISDIRVEGVKVIARGARGQATVTKVKSPLTTLNYSGIGLRLDWIEDVAGEHLALRAKPEGQPSPFMTTIVRDETGVVAGPGVGKNLSVGSALYHGFMRTNQMPYIPVGARIFGYIQGSTRINIANIRELEDPQTPAVITIFRMYDRIGGPIELICDGKKIAELAPEQHVSLDVLEGPHSCQATNGGSLAVTAQPGDQYFIRVDGRTRTLVRVSVGEGEECVEKSTSVDPL
jgi:hypothetical protein